MDHASETTKQPLEQHLAAALRSFGALMDSVNAARLDRLAQDVSDLDQKFEWHARREIVAPITRDIDRVQRTISIMHVRCVSGGCIPPEDLATCFQSISVELNNILRRLGATSIDFTPGTPFDPESMSATECPVSDGGTNYVIAKSVRPGLRVDSIVIRPQEVELKHLDSVNHVAAEHDGLESAHAQGDEDDLR